MYAFPDGMAAFSLHFEGKTMICKAHFRVAPLQIAQSPAAKVFDQKGSTAAALESSKSVIFAASDTPQIYHISLLYKRVVSDGAFPNLCMSFPWT